VKILDIGVGRALFDEGSPGEPPHLTATGDQLGTPLYCAPEQSKDARQADVRSDVYSLGCVLYHALTGQPPFEDNGPIRLVLSHATEAPRPLLLLNVTVPSRLQKALDIMLAKDPALRFPTPAQAAQELRQFLPQ
jgi:serine/threonine-protein kinase